MKTTINLILLTLIIIISTNSCSKQEDCENPVDCLPPATQIGANTAGCLINGEVFLPGGRSLGSGSVLKAQYIFSDGRYIFGISIRNRDKNNRMVMIESKENKIIEGQTYDLGETSPTSISGIYIVGLDGYSTTNTQIGEFKITRLDETESIISGTFWFDAINEDGEVVEVREGRFDVRY